MQEGPHWFAGTPEAVCQNLGLIMDHHADLVLVFGADHIYRMDVGQMIDFHLGRGADVTLAALPVPLERASDFGIIDVDEQDRGRGFEVMTSEPGKAPS